MAFNWYVIIFCIQKYTQNMYHIHSFQFLFSIIQTHFIYLLCAFLYTHGRYATIENVIWFQESISKIDCWTLLNLHFQFNSIHQFVNIVSKRMVVHQHIPPNKRTEKKIQTGWQLTRENFFHFHSKCFCRWRCVVSLYDKSQRKNGNCLTIEMTW